MVVSSTLPVTRNRAAAMKAHTTWTSTTTRGSGWWTIPATVTDPVPRPIYSDGRTVIVVFVCENSARPGRRPSSGERQRPEPPDFGWPFPVREVVVPCAGRLQPEHLLKAFEDGADAVGVLCCAEGNCHHQEGSKRCRRRVEAVSSLLGEIGLGKERLMLLHLPGSAEQDMALGAGAAKLVSVDQPLEQRVAAVRDEFVAGVAALAPTPLRSTGLSEDVPHQLESEDVSD